MTAYRWHSLNNAWLHFLRVTYIIYFTTLAKYSSMCITSIDSSKELCTATVLIIVFKTTHLCTRIHPPFCKRRKGDTSRREKVRGENHTILWKFWSSPPLETWWIVSAYLYLSTQFQNPSSSHFSITYKKQCVGLKKCCPSIWICTSQLGGGGGLWLICAY